MPSQGWLPRKWPSIKPLRIFAPTIGQQGGTWQVFRASSASCSGQVQASESTTEIMNAFFHFRNMHSKCFHGGCFHIQMHFLKNCRAYASAKCIFSLPEMHSRCSFMVTVSTFKCIDLKNCRAYASAKCMIFHFQKCIPNALSWWLFPHLNTFSQVYASAKCIFSLPEMHSKCFFMVAVSTFKCIFLKYCRAYASAKCFFHFQKCIPNALSWWLFDIKCIFSNIVWCMLRLKCIFFTSANSISNAHSWRLLPHSYAILFRNVRLHTSVHARVRALARTEQLLQIFF